MRKYHLVTAALLLALALTLSGCNLVGIDPLMQLAEDRAAVEKTYQAVLADYDGGSVTVEDAALDFYNTYQMYLYSGLTMGEEDIASLKEAAVGYALERVAQAREAEARSITLTEAEIEEIRAEARENYATNLEGYAPQMDGRTDEIRNAQAALELYAQGISEESMYDYLAAEKLAGKLREVLDAEVTEVSEEALEEAYKQRVEDDESYYAEDLGGFESDMSSGTLILWRPEGYRTVKHILVIPEDAVLAPHTEKTSQISAFKEELASLEDDLAAATDDDASEGDPESIRTQIAAVEASIAAAEAELPALEAAVLASVQDKLDAIQQRLAAGEDFMALVDEYGEDDGMRREPNRTSGYYVSAESTTWDPAFKNAAMLLENVGDVSAPVVGQSGVHIIRYESDVTPGAVPLADVREALTEETLESQRDERYTTSLAEWVEALNPVYHYENWNP